jgi:hypothetical protein
MGASFLFGFVGGLRPFGLMADAPYENAPILIQSGAAVNTLNRSLPLDNLLV